MHHNEKAYNEAPFLEGQRFMVIYMTEKIQKKNNAIVQNHSFLFYDTQHYKQLYIAKSDRTIYIGFKVEDGADGLKALIMNAEDLRKVLRANVEQLKELQTIKDFFSAQQAIGVMGDSCR